ncbi:hypothetical protein Taro_019707 [Colocasia esculenta]|uniref:Uncharacterized protein n=1 Tax=Colocasia esculenta TaxID=4460 RepID=A0A843UZZ9_COLES|nr:hypothetical protein [Colocasia esculenta]
MTVGHRLVALVVGGTDTSRRTGPQLILFPVPHSRGLRPESLEVPGIGLRQCSPQLLYLSWFARILGSFPTEPVTCEAHPYSLQVKESRRFLFRLPVRSRIAAVLGRHL